MPLPPAIAKRQTPRADATAMAIGSERSEVRGTAQALPPVDAMRRYREAVQAIGSALAPIVLHVVLRNGTLAAWVDVRRAADAAPELRYRVARRVRAQLIEGMERLEAHYGDEITLQDEQRVDS